MLLIELEGKKNTIFFGLKSEVVVAVLVQNVLISLGTLWSFSSW
jgi:hypothetical protein